MSSLNFSYLGLATSSWKEGCSPILNSYYLGHQVSETMMGNHLDNHLLERVSVTLTPLTPPIWDHLGFLRPHLATDS
jgi:hypothetical protein